MFTGLIQEKGKLTRIIPRGRTILLTCRASKKLLADYQIGDSMATVSYTHLTLPTKLEV